MYTYDGSDEEWPFEGVDLGFVCGDWFEVLHLVHEVGCILRLHVEENQPEVDSDACEHRAEVSAAEIELLLGREISHIIL